MRVTPNHYPIGEIPRLIVEFYDEGDVLADPSAVSFSVIEPDDDATETVYIFGTDVELVKQAVGIYYVDWQTAFVGTHCVRWVGSGAIRKVVDKPFVVDLRCAT